MSWRRAINEIQGLLTQGGTPTNHAQDIAARLSFAMEEYYNYRQELGNARNLNAGSSDTSDFKKSFSTAESNPGGSGGSGSDGKDGQGAYAWAAGKDGKDGESGGSGQDGYGQDGQGGGFGGGGGGGLDIRSVNCMDLKAKLKSCGIDTGKECDCKKMECGGILAGKSLCQVVENQARELKRARERLDAIEKQLKDTVNC